MATYGDASNLQLNGSAPPVFEQVRAAIGVRVSIGAEPTILLATNSTDVSAQINQIIDDAEVTEDTGVVLVFDPKIYYIKDNDVTFPEYVTVIHEHGAIIRVKGDKTVTFQGDFISNGGMISDNSEVGGAEANGKLIFNGRFSHPGGQAFVQTAPNEVPPRIEFGVGAVDKVDSTWFGMSTDDDNTTANRDDFQSAINISAAANVPCYVPSGHYIISGTEAVIYGHYDASLNKGFPSAAESQRITIMGSEHGNTWDNVRNNTWVGSTIEWEDVSTVPSAMVFSGQNVRLQDITVISNHPVTSVTPDPNAAAALGGALTLAEEPGYTGVSERDYRVTLEGLGLNLRVEYNDNTEWQTLLVENDWEEGVIYGVEEGIAFSIVPGVTPADGWEWTWTMTPGGSVVSMEDVSESTMERVVLVQNGKGGCGLLVDAENLVARQVLVANRAGSSSVDSRKGGIGIGVKGTNYGPGAVLFDSCSTRNFGMAAQVGLDKIDTELSPSYIRNVQFRSCDFKDAPAGVKVGSYAENILFDACHFEVRKEDSNAGTSYETPNDDIVGTTCLLIDGIAATGTYYPSGNKVTPSGVTVRDCHFIAQDASVAAIDWEVGNEVNITGCRFSEISKIGVLRESGPNVTGGTVDHCVFEPIGFSVDSVITYADVVYTAFTTGPHNIETADQIRFDGVAGTGFADGVNYTSASNYGQTFIGDADGPFGINVSYWPADSDVDMSGWEHTADTGAVTRSIAMTLEPDAITITEATIADGLVHVNRGMRKFVLGSNTFASDNGVSIIPIGTHNPTDTQSPSRPWVTEDVVLRISKCTAAHATNLTDDNNALPELMPGDIIENVTDGSRVKITEAVSALLTGECTDVGNTYRLKDTKSWASLIPSFLTGGIVTNITQGATLPMGTCHHVAYELHFRDTTTGHELSNGAMFNDGDTYSIQLNVLPITDVLVGSTDGGGNSWAIDDYYIIRRPRRLGSDEDATFTIDEARDWRDL